jgi:hypothetical protein
MTGSVAQLRQLLQDNEAVFAALRQRREVLRAELSCVTARIADLHSAAFTHGPANSTQLRYRDPFSALGTAQHPRQVPALGYHEVGQQLAQEAFAHPGSKRWGPTEEANARVALDQYRRDRELWDSTQSQSVDWAEVSQSALGMGSHRLAWERDPAVLAPKSTQAFRLLLEHEPRQTAVPDGPQTDSIRAAVNRIVVAIDDGASTAAVRQQWADLAADTGYSPAAMAAVVHQTAPRRWNVVEDAQVREIASTAASIEETAAVFNTQRGAAHRQLGPALASWAPLEPRDVHRRLQSLGLDPDWAWGDAPPQMPLATLTLESPASPTTNVSEPVTPIAPTCGAGSSLSLRDATARIAFEALDHAVKQCAGMFFGAMSPVDFKLMLRLAKLRKASAFTAAQAAPLPASSSSSPGNARNEEASMVQPDQRTNGRKARPPPQ